VATIHLISNLTGDEGAVYDVSWDIETGGILLKDEAAESIPGAVRPVFHEELDLLGLQNYWKYEPHMVPLLWAVGRRYYYRGQFVAEAIGGSFFERPRMHVQAEGLALEPVDLSGMLERNDSILRDMVHATLDCIKAVHERYRDRVDTVAVAFSGGKDSLVLLDLVQRVLPPDEFVVVFNDTTMELSATYEAVEAAKKRWGKLRFFTARAPRPARETWQEFGPPSRLHRWCCTVHKSAPTLRLLREMCGRPAVRALIYDGNRREESPARAAYPAVSEGKKHPGQINVSPLLNWGLTEVHLYLMCRDLLLNRAYRWGVVRVGCAVCPFASQWSNFVCGFCFREDALIFLELLESYARKKGISSEVGRRRFIAERSWASRAGGREMAARARVFLEEQDGQVVFLLRRPREDWLEWAKALGSVELEAPGRGVITNSFGSFPFRLRDYEKGLAVTITRVAGTDPIFKSRLRAVANKAAYCVGCRSCEVECPTGALRVDKKVAINAVRCSHCGRCLSFVEKSCLAAKSLSVTGSGDRVKGLNRYQEFGMRKQWLAEYLRNPQSWWVENTLGNRQLEAMRVWLREAELAENQSLGLTPLGDRLQQLGADHLLTWAVVWTNLAHNSALVNWYVQEVGWGIRWTKRGLVSLMSEDLSQRTRENAVDALVGLLTHTPLGEQLGLGCAERKGRVIQAVTKHGWADPHPVALLYALYRLAEKLTRYNFTLSELFEEKIESPFLLFGVGRELLTRYLQGLSVNRPDWIRVEAVRDLDNVYLEEGRRAFEVLDLVLART